MGWRLRCGRKYYYRKNGNHPTRQYVGRGPVAEFVADMDAFDRAEFLVRRRDEQLARRRWKEVDRVFLAAQAAIKTLVDSTLIGLGYHTYNRSRWQKPERLRQENQAQEEWGGGSLSNL